jgi:Fur family transcriptional regulator, ferric uptake regulator
MTTQSANRLREAGFRATPGRIAILELLKLASRPQSTQEIMKGLRKEKLDQATVYRMLEAFKEKGIVRAIHLGHDHVDYELTDPKDHHHLICTKCDKVEDVQGCDLEALSKSTLKNSKNFSEINQHSLEFFGICKACAKI